MSHKMMIVFLGESFAFGENEETNYLLSELQTLY